MPIHCSLVRPVNFPFAPWAAKCASSAKTGMRSPIMSSWNSHPAAPGVQGGHSMTAADTTHWPGPGSAFLNVLPLGPCTAKTGLQRKAMSVVIRPGLEDRGHDHTHTHRFHVQKCKRGWLAQGMCPSVTLLHSFALTEPTLNSWAQGLTPSVLKGRTSSLGYNRRAVLQSTLRPLVTSGKVHKLEKAEESVYN